MLTPSLSTRNARRQRRLVPALIVLLVISLSFTACKRRQQQEQEQEQWPGQWAPTLQHLALHIPDDVASAAFIIDHTEALRSWPGLRNRAEVYIGDLAPVENDLRNTLGVDLSRPEQLAELGIRPDGGSILFVLDGRFVAGATLIDDEAFEQHVTTMLQGEPFDMDEPARSASEEGYVTLHFGGPESPDATVVITENFAWAATPGFGSDDSELLDELLSDEERLNHSEDFGALAAQTQQYPFLVYVEDEEAAEAVQSMASVALPATIDVSEIAEDMMLALRLDADRLAGAVTSPLEADAGLRQLLTRPEGGQAADFSTYTSDESYFFVRLRSEPTVIRDLLQETLLQPSDSDADNDETQRQEEESSEDDQSASNAEGEPEPPQDEAQQQNGADTRRPALGTLEDVDPAALGGAIRGIAVDADELVGMSVDEELVPAFGSDFIVMATRARMLSLSSVVRGTPNVRNITQSFGVVLAMQVRDTAVVQRAFDAVLQNDPTLLRPLEDAPVPAWAVRAQNGGDLDLFLTDDALIISSSRQRSDTIEMLAEQDAPTYTEIGATAARELIGATDQVGIYLDLKRITNGAIGTLLGGQLPGGIQDMLQIFDEFWATAELEDTYIEGRFEIILSQP